MEETYYRKVGRRYIPVHQTLDTYGWPEGCYVVWVTPGSTSIRTTAEPAYAELLAASKVAEDAMLKSMRDMDRVRPAVNPLTPRQKKAWEEFSKAMGEEMSLWGKSMQDIVDAGLEALRKAAVEQRRRGKK